MSCVLWELHQQCLVVLPPSNIMSCVQINYNRTQSSMRRLDASLLLVCVHFHQRCRTSPSCLKILSRKFVVWGRPTPRMRQVVRGRLTPYKCQASNLIGLFVDLTLTCVLLLLGLTPTFITAVQLLAHLPPLQDQFLITFSSELGSPLMLVWSQRPRSLALWPHLIPLPPLYP